MKLLDRSSCGPTALDLGFSIDVEAGEIQLGQHESKEVHLVYEKWPAHWLVGLSKAISEAVQPFDSCLLVLTEIGIWPSSEDPYLFQKLRLSYGETSDVHDAPGQLFSAHECQDLRVFLTLALLFGWGGFVLPHRTDSSSFALVFSHDGWLTAYFKGESPHHLERLAAGPSFSPGDGKL